MNHLETWNKVAKGLRDHYLANAEKIEAGDAQAKHKYDEWQKLNQDWTNWVTTNVFNKAAPAAPKRKIDFNFVNSLSNTALLALMEETSDEERAAFWKSLTQHQESTLMMKYSHALEQQDQNRIGAHREGIGAHA